MRDEVKEKRKRKKRYEEEKESGIEADMKRGV
jgi:hypothetical protein